MRHNPPAQRPSACPIDLFNDQLDPLNPYQAMPLAERESASVTAVGIAEQAGRAQ